jgi:hypothetical protein
VVRVYISATREIREIGGDADKKIVGRETNFI